MTTQNFQIQLTVPDNPIVKRSNNQYYLQATQDYQLPENGSNYFDTGCIINQLPPNCIVQLTLTPQSYQSQLRAPPHRYQQQDVGKKMVPHVFSRKKKRGRKGDNIFTMMLKSIPQAAIDILPMLLGTQQQQQQINQNKRQRNTILSCPSGRKRKRSLL